MWNTIFISKKSTKNDWATSGFKCKTDKRYLLSAAMKQHLKSSEHQSSEKLHKEENLLYSTKGIPSQKLSAKCTENSMFVAQLMASYSL